MKNFRAFPVSQRNVQSSWKKMLQWRRQKCFVVAMGFFSFPYNSKVSVTLARNGNGGENAKLVNPGLSSLHFKNVTIGFSKKGFTKGYSIVPRHKSSLQPNRTFFSSWSI